MFDFAYFPHKVHVLSSCHLYFYYQYLYTLVLHYRVEGISFAHFFNIVINKLGLIFGTSPNVHDANHHMERSETPKNINKWKDRIVGELSENVKVMFMAPKSKLWHFLFPNNLKDNFEKTFVKFRGLSWVGVPLDHLLNSSNKLLWYK